MKTRTVLEVAVTAAILAVLVVHLGAGPFLAGLRAVTLPSIGIAVVIAAFTTLCSAWRWRLFTESLGLALPMTNAVASYYRSQFLNTVLPAGVLGDVHRAVRHGVETGTVRRAGRAVVEERVAGQLVQIGVTVVALAVASSLLPTAVLVAVVFVLICVVGAAWKFGHVPRAWPGILLASLAVVIGHVATFLLAAHTVGVAVSLPHLVPVSLLVMVGAAVPLNVGGWGPREGAAVWAFELAGLSGADGLAVSTTFGVFAMVASLPGALALLVPHRRQQEPGELMGGAPAHG